MNYSVEQAKEIISKSIQVRSVELIGCGNHSEAFCINDEMVMKLPKHQKASDCLKVEMQILRGLKEKVPLDIPNVLFNGTFPSGQEEFVYFVSKRLKGKNLSKKEFLLLDEKTLFQNAERIAKFLYRLHSEKEILPIKRKDLVLLHGDFSLNHIVFNDKNVVCGVLDFADSRVGKPQSDFAYLLDEEDDEEFGADFGRMVLDMYRGYQCSET
ncbi:MAG: phosphotransferase [Lachnospiraceae bacterium]|jgi:aminoglycoside phosphotransferase (APT) family kinase protein|nr:phosphotransferase [Lachnospiraceae bacterium]